MMVKTHTVLGLEVVVLVGRMPFLMPDFLNDCVSDIQNYTSVFIVLSYKHDLLYKAIEA